MIAVHSPITLLPVSPSASHSYTHSVLLLTIIMPECFYIEKPADFATEFVQLCNFVLHVDIHEVVKKEPVHKIKTRSCLL